MKLVWLVPLCQSIQLDQQFHMTPFLMKHTQTFMLKQKSEQEKADQSLMQTDQEEV